MHRHNRSMSLFMMVLYRVSPACKIGDILAMPFDDKFAMSFDDSWSKHCINSPLKVLETRTL